MSGANPSPRKPINVAVVGGDATRELPAVDGAVIRRFPSSGDGGNGGHQSALAAIRGRSFALVVIHARWMGHCDSHNLREACRSADVPYRVVTGGRSSVRRVVQSFVTGDDGGAPHRL